MRDPITRTAAPMSRRRSKRPDGVVYRELRKGRPGTFARKRRLLQIELLILATLLALVAAGVWWFFFKA